MHLKGMTWDHPRGYEPMPATAAEYARTHPGVEITWDKRSLQAFADAPVEKLAEEYDLIVIDHPHCGFVARHGCLVAFDLQGRDAELKKLASESLGGSHETYQYDGHQWALAIDAATPTASFRPDLITAPPTNWGELLDLAKQGRVLWPLKPVDSLMSFFGMAANRGTPCRSNGKLGAALIAPDAAKAVLDHLQTIVRHLPAECLSMNPIETYEWMSRADNERYAYCPLAYSYNNYSRQGFRPHRLRFADMPEFVPGAGPRGSTVGGTGIAISNQCKHIDLAVDYAFWIASADCQRGLYFDANGQPGNAAAWDDNRCNAATLDFFRNTRRTQDLVYLRPRYPGYLDFQDEGGDIVNAFLRGKSGIDQTAAALEAAYQRSIEG